MIAARLTIRHRLTSLADVAGELEGVALESWLCSAELEVVSSLRDPKRKTAWLAGRFLAKRLILSTLAEVGTSRHHRGAETLTWTDICILSRDACERGVHPLVLLHGKLMPWTLSLSHSEDSLAAVLALTEDVRLGVDLTRTADVTQRLAKAWFTTAEWDYVHQTVGLNPTDNQQPELSDLIATIWSAKEAAYKALNEGESFAPKRMEVAPVAKNRWQVCWQVGRTPRQCQVYTETTAGTVRAMAAVGWTGLTEKVN